MKKLAGLIFIITMALGLSISVSAATYEADSGICDVHTADEGVVTTEPTCTEEGAITYTCTVCGSEWAEVLEPLGHTWDVTISGNGCTEDKVTTYTCTVCGAVETSTSEASGGHIWDSGVITKSATCTGTGVRTYTCQECGETKTETIAAAGHTWDSGKVTKAATTSSAGTKTYTCTACGTTKTESIAKLKTLATPSGLKASNAATGVKVTWGKVSGASKYRVYRKTSGGSWKRVGETTSVSYTDTTAKSNTTYYYTVRCITSDGSATVSDYNKTGAKIKYYAAPSLSGVTVTSSGAKVTWGSVSGASKYRVYRKTGANGSWARIKDTSSTSYTDTTVKSNKTYYYTVRVLNSSGTTVSSYNSSGVKLTYHSTPKMTAVTNTATGLKVTWEKVSGASKYRVYRKTSGGSWKRIGEAASASYTDTTASSGTVYYYTVRCMDSGGTLTSWYQSGLSLRYLSQPSVSVSNTDSGVKISWKKITGAKGYYVYRKTSSSDWSRIADVTAVNYYDATAVNGTTYYYTVRAYNGSVKSSYKASAALKINVPIADVTTFLGSAMKPVGTTLYVWGGGWNTADNAAGEAALYKGVYPTWKTYFNSNAKGYSYLPGKKSWQNGSRKWRLYGLDCSGFVGWTMYNTILSNGKSGGYVVSSTKMASTMASYGYGSASKCTPSSTFKAGDIISLNGHVVICLGQCSDGSVLIVHSTTNGGVQLSGTVKSGKTSSEASKLASEYMKKNYPTWWKYFGGEKKQAVSASTYLNGTKFTWKSNSKILDSAGLRNMSADEVLEYLTS